MELKIYLRMLQKGWWLIVLGTLFGFMTSLLMSYFAAPQYRATARFIIMPSASLKTNKEVVDSLNTLDRASVVATYAEVMNSARVLEASIASLQVDPQLMRDYVVKAVVLPTSSVLELTVSGPNPNAVAELANMIGKQTIQFAESSNFIFDMNFLDTANPPADPYSPQPLRDAGLSLSLGAILGALLALIGEQVRTPLEAFSQHLRLDSASGVYTSRHFLRLLEEEINEHPDASLAVGVIELDGLKDIPDTLPASGVHKLLQTAARRLERELRGNDIIGRWNDNSFSVILPDTSSAPASRTFERIHQALTSPVDLNKYDLSVNLKPHIGAAVYSNHITMSELLEKVEGSLEEAHRRNGNASQVYLWDLKNPFWEQTASN